MTNFRVKRIGFYGCIIVSFLLQRRNVVEGWVIVTPPFSFHNKYRNIPLTFFPTQRLATSRGATHTNMDKDDDDDSEWTRVKINEVLDNNAVLDDDEADDWIPDRERARQQKLNARIYAEKEGQPRASPYTEDEEDLIAAMGGKTRQAPREEGFLGDSTLHEICRDYSVPICYIADVLCLWGIPPPIHVHDRLGDLVTGEQAFALLEAINSLDVAALQDRYSNQSLWQICQEWEIDLAQGFQMSMTEGWSLPFGVHTNLRVEQENELIRVLGNPLAMTRGMDDDDDEDYEWDDEDD